MIFSSGVFAQTAEEILRKAESSFRNDGGIIADFQLSVENKNKKTEQFDGTIKMKGSCFYIQTPDIKVWFDGKNQWTLLSNSNEVNLTQPSGAELDTMNPAVLFNLYKNGYKASKNNGDKLNSPDYYQIKLLPVKNGDVKSILVLIDKKNYQIKEIFMALSNSSSNKIQINKYQTKQSLSDNDFKFSAKQYPDLDIIDLR